MRVIVQNVQKRPGLASSLIREHKPDVLLAQEINLKTEDKSLFETAAHSTSKMGFGTAVYGRGPTSLTDMILVNSPHAETGWLIVKKTTVALYEDGVHLVSFHGYNGMPFKSVSKLIDHVAAVLAVIPKGTPAVFAGDFNTWSKEHVDAVTNLMMNDGFMLACSWPYLGRKLPLDHAFIRNLRLDSYTTYENESDHTGIILDLHLDP